MSGDHWAEVVGGGEQGEQNGETPLIRALSLEQETLQEWYHVLHLDPVGTIAHHTRAAWLHLEGQGYEMDSSGSVECEGVFSSGAEASFSLLLFSLMAGGLTGDSEPNPAPLQDIILAHSSSARGCWRPPIEPRPRTHRVADRAEIWRK